MVNDLENTKMPLKRLSLSLYNKSPKFQIISGGKFVKGTAISSRSKMEASECEAIFDSFNLNPQLFINAALNTVDELIDSAFTYLHQEASTQLKVDGSDRAEDLTKGLDYIGNMIRSALDKRLTMWEKYCFLRVFVVPEGFSLPKDDEAFDGDAMDVEAVGNSDLDVQLDSLRTKLTLAEQESAKLKREIQALEIQSVISNHQAASVNELMKLSEQISEDDAFKELQKLATELRAKAEKLQTKRADDIQRARLERLCLWNGDLLRIIGGNGLSNAKPEEIEGFLAGELSPAQVLDLVSSNNYTLIDIRSENDKDKSGIPRLPASAKNKLIAVPLEGLSSKLKGLVKNTKKLEAEIAAIKISYLKKINKGSKIVILDTYTDSAKIVARYLTELGFQNCWIVADGFSGGKGWLQSRLGTDSYNVSFSRVLSPSRVIPAVRSFGTTGSTKLLSD